jgi:hypothetical protein
MGKPPLSDQFLYFLFTLLSLAFLGLLFVSLFLASPLATKVAGTPSPSCVLQAFTSNAVSMGSFKRPEAFGQSRAKLQERIRTR